MIGWSPPHLTPEQLEARRFVGVRLLKQGRLSCSPSVKTHLERVILPV